MNTHSHGPCLSLLFSGDKEGEGKSDEDEEMKSESDDKDDLLEEEDTSGDGKLLNGIMSGQKSHLKRLPDLGGKHFLDVFLEPKMFWHN